MTIYSVWTDYEYENEILAQFTNLEAANKYAELNDGKVWATTVFNTVAEAIEAEEE